MKIQNFWQRHAFTMIEVMVVVILVGVMAAFAIPSYTKSVERAYEKDGFTNLTLISGAQEVYKVKNGDYWPAATGACGGGNCGIANGLNTALGINIVENNMQYSCADRAAGTNYACYAARQGGNNFRLYIDETMAPNPPSVPCCNKNDPQCPTAPTCP